MKMWMQVSGLVVALTLTLAGSSNASDAGRELPLDMSSILEVLGDADFPLLDATERALGSQAAGGAEKPKLGPFTTRDGFKIKSVDLRPNSAIEAPTGAVVEMALQPCYSAAVVQERFRVDEAGAVQQVNHHAPGGTSIEFFDWIATRNNGREIRFFFDRTKCATAKIGQRSVFKQPA